MSLSNCPKCWETPCCCGHEYEHWSTKRLEENIALLQGVLARKHQGEPASQDVTAGEQENPMLKTLMNRQT